MDCVGQACAASQASNVYSAATGRAMTTDWLRVSPNTVGASSRHVPQSMHRSSTNHSPGALPGWARSTRAIPERYPPACPTSCGYALRPQRTVSSVGRAPPLQGGCRGFEPLTVHHQGRITTCDTPVSAGLSFSALGDLGNGLSVSASPRVLAIVRPRPGHSRCARRSVR
jgi:hypothetical protein